MKPTYSWERLPAAKFDLAAGSRSHIRYRLCLLVNRKMKISEGIVFATPLPNRNLIVQP